MVGSRKGGEPKSRKVKKMCGRCSRQKEAEKRRNQNERIGKRDVYVSDV